MNQPSIKSRLFSLSGVLLLAGSILMTRFTIKSPEAAQEAKLRRAEILEAMLQKS